MTSATTPLPRPAPRRWISGRVVAAIAACGLALAIALLAGGPRGPLALAALSAAVVLLVMLVRPELATLAFVAGIYLNLPVVLPEFYGVPAIAAATIAALPLIPLGAYVIRRQPPLLNPVLGPILLYFVAMLVSAVATGEPEKSFEVIGVFLTEGLLIFILVTNAVRSMSTIRNVTWVLVAVGGLLGALSVLQTVSGTPGATFGGLAQIDPGAAQDPATAILEPDRLERLAGPIGETNRYAQIMLVLFPLAVSRIRAERGRLQRLAALGAAMLILAGTFLTYSRGAAVALALLLLVMLAWRLVRPAQVVVFGAAMVLIVVVVAPQYTTRVESLTGVEALFGGPQEADGAIVGRATSNLAALYVFVDHPITGVGPGRYADDYSRQYANRLGLRYFDTSRRAHNLYLEIAAETGLIGLGTFLTAVGYTFVQLARERRWWLSRSRGHAEMAGGFALALLAYMTAGLFLHLSYQRYLWLVVGLAAALIWILRAERARFEPQP